ncbi:MAG: MutT/nudix family protein [Caulobacteraceae bacterium]|nr:MutT/nudix family protein [Caulobacteraceae bacterium]
MIVPEIASEIAAGITREARDELRSWISGHLDPLDDPAPSGTHRGWEADPQEAFTPAAVLVALVEREAGLSVLLTRRSDALRSHSGQVALPGGRRDPGETPWETALREAEEEIGLDRSFVTLAGLSTPYRTLTGYQIVPVVGFVTPGFTLDPNPDEVADIFETPFGHLMDPANYEEQERTSSSGEVRRFYATTHEDRTIWGVTAAMLRDLYDRLYGAALA